MTAPWNQYSEAEMANMSVDDNWVAKRHELQRQEEDDRRGGKGVARPARSFSFRENLTWWLLVAAAVLFLVGLLPWLMLTSSISGNVRGVLEVSPLEGSVAATYQDAAGQPALVGAVTAAAFLVVVIVVTVAINRWIRSWARSTAGRVKLISGGLVLNLVRTAIGFAGLTMSLSAAAVAQGQDLRPDSELGAYPPSGWLALMAVPVLMVTLSSAIRTWRRAWDEVDRLEAAGHRW